MIDVLTEELISPREATQLFPRGPNGKRPHVSKVYRFMQVGHKGVVLESLRTPNRCTSREAVARFFERINQVAAVIHLPKSEAASDRRRHDEVEQELQRLGL